MNKFVYFVFVCVLILGACNNQKVSDRYRTNKKEVLTVRKVAYTRQTETSTPEINVEMNGVPFKMMWDTGAAGTTISFQECLSLYKAGVLSDNNIKCYASCTVADGSEVTVPVYSIRELVIRTDGEPYVVNNVEVMVMSNISASMLLGQNVMKELPEYSFNDLEQVIVFKDE